MHLSNVYRTVCTTFLLLTVVYGGTDDKVSTYREKMIIFTSFTVFVVVVVVVHCCLKHKKVEEEERRRDFMDYENYVTITQHGRVVILPIRQTSEDGMTTFCEQENGKMWY